MSDMIRHLLEGTNIKELSLANKGQLDLKLLLDSLSLSEPVLEKLVKVVSMGDGDESRGLLNWTVKVSKRRLDY